MAPAAEFNAADSDLEVLGQLFESYRGAGLDLSNRLVMAPMTRSMAVDGVITGESAGYYARRAAGGIGLIITEGTWVSHESASFRRSVPRFYGTDAIAAWRGVVEAVHAAGGKLFPQFWHSGMIRKLGDDAFSPSASPVGPSGISYLADERRYSATQPEMTLPQIEAVVESFADAAQVAQSIGFDGIELHGAHGYLIDQFLWSVTNRRTDPYGGSIGDRVRFAAEIVRACRQRTGGSFPISFRFSDWKVDDYDAQLVASPWELASLLEPLVDAGVDIFHCSTRRCWEPRFAGDARTFAGWTKAITGKTTICVGSIGLAKDLDTKAESRDKTLQYPPAPLGKMQGMAGRNEFDLAAVGRMLIANPDWARLVEARASQNLKAYSPRMKDALI